MLTLRLMGGMDLTGGSSGDVRAVLSHPKQMAVLVFLALKGGRGYVHRDRLMGLLWPESDIAHARNTLNQALHGLRRGLGRGVVVTRGRHEVGLDPAKFECDAWAFRDAIDRGDPEAALACYMGELLPGFYVSGSGDFERWLQEERGLLREAAADAAWRCAHGRLAVGALTRAERAGQRALDLVPTDESSVRAFIEALAGAGDRAAAVNFFERFRSRLWDELELEPLLQTVELAKRVRTEDAMRLVGSAGDGSVERSVPSPPRTAPAPRSVLRGDPAPPPEGMERSTPGDAARRRRAAYGSGFLVIALATLVIAWFWPSRAWEPNPWDVAVAPFVNRTGDPTRDDLGQLIAENIRVRLGQAEIGNVFPQTIIHRALDRAGSEADQFEVLTRDMGAGIVVTGEFFYRGDTLVISAYCLDARDARDLGAITPARGVRSDERSVIAQIQDRVSGVLAQTLEPPHAGGRVVRPPLNVEAFRAYQRAWDAQSGEQADIEAALPLFYRAFELDSTYMAPLIRAWFLLMWWEERGQGDNSYAAERDSLFEALDRSRHLMSLAQSQWMDWAQAEFQEPRDPELALRTARRASETAATDFAYELGFSAARLNYLDEALDAFQRYDKGQGEFLEALADYNYFFDYAQVLHRVGRHQKELEILLAGQSRYPDMPALRHLELRARVALGDVETADSLAEGVPRYSDWMYMVHPAQLEFYGYPDRARAFLEGEVQRFEVDSVYLVEPRARAGVLSALGRQDEALTILEPLLRERPNDPGFVRMLGIAAARMGDTARAHEMDRRLAEIPSVQRAPWARAFLAASLGEKNRALGFLKQIPHTQGGWFMFRHGADFRSLQGYPPFEDFMRPKR